MEKPKYDMMHVYCKDGVKAMVERLAKRSKRSMSSEVQFLIEQEHRRLFGEKKFPRKPKLL